MERIGVLAEGILMKNNPQTWNFWP